MPIPINENDTGYRFFKTLNEDIKLVDNGYGEYDMEFTNGDIVNLTGVDSLHNAIIIAILTRYRELKHNQLYDEFGCRVHELIKANKSRMAKYRIEKYVEETLLNMRRIRRINSLLVNEIENGYKVDFDVTSISDETVKGTVSL